MSEARSGSLFPVSSETLLLLAVGVAGYTLIKKTGTALTLFKTDDQVKAERSSATAIKSGIDAARAAQKTTKTDAEWAAIAEQIYRDLRYSSAGDNKDNALVQACRVKNDADFWTLYKFYGRRQETWFGILPDGDPKDLIQSLVSNLSAGQITTINSNYSRKAMKFSL